MAAITNPIIGALIQHEPSSSSIVQSPGKVLVHDSVPKPKNIELDSLQWGQKLTGPASVPGGAEPSNPQTPGDLEQSHPATPIGENAVDAFAALSPYSPRNRWRLAATGVIFIFVGMTDAVVRICCRPTAGLGLTSHTDRSCTALDRAAV
jgi:hypothetical protein